MIARLLDYRDIGREVRHFRFEVPETPTLAYEAGQFISVTSAIGGKPVTRAYSIASAPSGNRFELCLNRVKDGLLSPWMFELNNGGALEFSGPLGYFVAKDPFRASVFIATGTGIAPFRAILQSARLAASATPVTLLFGARYSDGLLFGEEFERLQRERPGFRFLPTITRPGEEWKGRTGRVQQHLEEALDGRSDVDVYACGLKAMVDAVRAELKSRGFDRKQVVYEKYD